MAAFFVSVRRRGVSPHEMTMLVRAPSREAAAELATAIAERESGGFFEAAGVRRAGYDASRHHPTAYDDGV